MKDRMLLPGILYIVLGKIWHYCYEEAYKPKVVFTLEDENLTCEHCGDNLSAYIPFIKLYNKINP